MTLACGTFCNLCLSKRGHFQRRASAFKVRLYDTLFCRGLLSEVMKKSARESDEEKFVIRFGERVCKASNVFKVSALQFDPDFRLTATVCGFIYRNMYVKQLYNFFISPI